MGGMWTIPFVWIIFLTHNEKMSYIDYMRAALISIVNFGLAEHFTFPLNLWHCTDKVTVKIGKLAMYVLPAEMMLGPAILFFFSNVNENGRSSIWNMIMSSIFISLFYTGALAISFLLIEKVKL